MADLAHVCKRCQSSGVGDGAENQRSLAHDTYCHNVSDVAQVDLASAKAAFHDIDTNSPDTPISYVRRAISSRGCRRRGMRPLLTPGRLETPTSSRGNRASDVRYRRVGRVGVDVVECGLNETDVVYVIR